MNSLLVSKKYLIFADSKRRRPQNLFYVVEILEKSPNFEDRGGECSPPLILYMEKEKQRRMS